MTVDALVRLAPRLRAPAAAVVWLLALGAVTYQPDADAAPVVAAVVHVDPPAVAPAPTQAPDTVAPAPVPTVEPAPAPAPPEPAVEAVVAAPRDPAAPLRVMFLGDSMAWTIAQAVAPHAAAHQATVANAGIWGCGVVRGTPFRYFGSLYDVLPNGCDDWPGLWRAALERDRPDVAVIIVGRWELMDRVHAGGWTHIGTPAFDAYLASELDLAIATVAAAGARPVVATAPYFRRGSRPDGGTWPEDAPPRVDRVNQLLREAAARQAGVATVLDLGAKLSPGGQMASVVDGVRVRTDGVHVAQDAGPWLAPWLFPELRQAVL